MSQACILYYSPEFVAAVKLMIEHHPTETQEILDFVWQLRLLHYPCYDV